MGIIKRCGLYVLLFGVSFIGLSGLLSDNVSAVSDYDDTVQNTDSIVLTPLQGGSCEENISSTWTNSLEYSGHNDWQELQQVVNGQLFGSLIITQTGNTVQIYWRVGTDVPATFWTAPNGAELLQISGGSPWKNIEIYKSNCAGGISYINRPADGTIPQNITIAQKNPDDSHPIQPFLVRDVQIDYPDGYEGSLVGQSIESIIIKPKPLLTVKDKIIEVNQTKILEHILREHNILWQNKSGYMTYIIWELDEYGETIGEPIHMKENVLESREFTYTFEDYGKYRLAVSYTFPSVIPLPIAPEGTEIIYQPFGFEMYIDGRVYNQGWDNQACIDGYCLGNNENLVDKCISETFPYVDIGACIGQTNSLISMLTFRTPEPDELGGGVFHDAVNGCRQLQVLDTWILSPNQTVCPMMPVEVRNTVTPFITFGLGLMAITFIARRQDVRSLD